MSDLDENFIANLMDHDLYPEEITDTRVYARCLSRGLKNKLYASERNWFKPEIQIYQQIMNLAANCLKPLQAIKYHISPQSDLNCLTKFHL